jgi:type VI secretion system secreted protein Hcp
MPLAPGGHAGAGNGACDIFLHVQTKRAGKIKGEAKSKDHTDDIEVAGWNWGVSTPTAIGTGQATARRSWTALTVKKHIDAATTPLMSALVTNDEVKEAKLSMRRAGGEQLDFMIITLRGARISGVQHDVNENGDTLETVSIHFTQVEVEYVPQRTAGGRGGSTTFTDSLPTEA